MTYTEEDVLNFENNFIWGWVFLPVVSTPVRMAASYTRVPAHNSCPWLVIPISYCSEEGTVNDLIGWVSETHMADLD